MWRYSCVNKEFKKGTFTLIYVLLIKPYFVKANEKLKTNKIILTIFIVFFLIKEA